MAQKHRNKNAPDHKKGPRDDQPKAPANIPAGVLPKLETLVQSMAKGLGFAVWGVEFAAGSRGAIARIYLDLKGNEHMAAGPERPEVSIDDCATFSRHLSVALDAEDTIPVGYTLEVSSPGMERRFFRLEQLPPYVGRELSLQLQRPLDHLVNEDDWFLGRKRFQGECTALGEDSITIVTEGRTVTVPWSDIRQCRLVHTFDTPKKPKGAAKKAPMPKDDHGSYHSTYSAENEEDAS